MNWGYSWICTTEIFTYFQFVQRVDQKRISNFPNDPWQIQNIEAKSFTRENEYNRVIRKVTLSSSCFLGLLSPAFPSFSWYSQKKNRHFNKSQYEMLQLSTKCWYSAFNAQGSRLIITVIQLGAVKIYVAAAAEALRKKERRGWNSVYHQNWWSWQCWSSINFWTWSLIMVGMKQIYTYIQTGIKQDSSS